MTTIYPNITITLRVFLCTLATNCSAERSFSSLKRLKTYLRSTLEQDRLNSLAILAIENDITQSLNYDHVINLFAEKKARRKKI